MKNTFGNSVAVTLFGESHGAAIGAVIDGLAPGIKVDDGFIAQKNDSQGFVEYSLESFSQNGFVLSNISLDLHKSDFEGNIVTEYEKKFVDLGMPIYRLEARMK